MLDLSYDHPFKILNPYVLICGLRSVLTQKDMSEPIKCILLRMEDTIMSCVKCGMIAMRKNHACALSKLQIADNREFCVTLEHHF